MRLDRPSYGGDRGGDKPPRPNEGVQPRDNPRIRQVPETNEGIGWPVDKPEKPETDAEKIKRLESELGDERRENARLGDSYERALQENTKLRHTVDFKDRELSQARIDNSRLTDTNARLVSDNMELRKQTAESSTVAGRIKSEATQAERAEKPPERRNWFPTDKMTGLGGAVAGVAGTYGVMVGSVSSKEEAFGVACAGAGLAALGFGREMYDKVNDWRDRRAEKKNAGL